MSRSFNPHSYEDCHVISTTFLLDACPASAIILPLLLIVDPTRKAARSFAPIALLGGLMIVFFQMPFWNEPEWTAKFIFIGSEMNPCYFFFHTTNFLLALGVMLNTPKYGWKGYLWALVPYALYYGYVAIVKTHFDCYYFVSGLSPHDWASEGQYHIIADVLKCSPQTAMIIGLIALPIVASGLVALSDLFKRFKWWNYGNAKGKPWYMWYDYNKFVPQRII